MPEKGAGVSLKDFSRGSVVEGQEREGDGAGPEREEKTDRLPGEESPCTGLRGLIRPCGHAPARDSLRAKKRERPQPFPSGLKGRCGDQP